MKRNFWSIIGIFCILIVVLCVNVVAAQDATPEATQQAVATPDQYGEIYNADPAVVQHALGTTVGVPDIALAAFYRAGLPVNSDMAALPMKCWKNSVCDTGTGGKITVALADGFGENVWRQVTHMEFILQALTYPEIGKIIYTDAQLDTQKAIADFRSLIAQNVNVIIGYPDAGDAMLPSVREATKRGIIYIPHSYGKLGQPGVDYPTYVAEDVCALGQHFADIMNQEVGSGKIAFLGGTPGNPLSAGWQNCEAKALSKNIQVVARADTNWTREGTLQAVSGILTANPDVKGFSYEAADSFLGGVRAFQAANLPLNITLTLRTDEVDLFCEWKQLNNPNFKIFYSTGGNYQSRIALTAAMMKLHGATLPSAVIIPVKMRQVDASSCDPNMPPLASVSSLVPVDIFTQMYPSGS